MQTGAHATQPRLDVAIARVETVELRVRGVGFPLRRQNRHDDQREQPQQRDGDNRPGPETPAGRHPHRMLFVHSLILSAKRARGHPVYRGYNHLPMKGSERHRLKENELSHVLGDATMRLQENRRTFGLAAGVVALLLVAGIGYWAWTTRSENRAQALLGDAIVIMQAPVSRAQTRSQA